VITTHLSFVPGWNAWQLRRVVGWAREHLPAPRVLVGDLNLPGPLPGLVSGWQRLSTLPTYPAADPRLGFDAALGEEPGPWRVAGSAVTPLPVSDHAALSVALSTDSGPRTRRR
jgi:endonuclease/exonuclease/phosphatase family metal-dependent hydrolase